MPQKTLYIVRQGRKLVAGRQMDFKTSAEAVARADRDTERFAGVIAVEQTVDVDTGEVLEGPAILAQHGEIPPGTFEE